MSISDAKTYDVFLSYSLTEGKSAAIVERALTEAGLSVFVDRKDAAAGEDWQESLWEGMANSEVVVVVAPSEHTVSSSQVVEVGAALAWQKPMYVVRSEDFSERLPSYLDSVPSFPLSRLDDLIRSTRAALKPTLSEDQREVLIAAYAKVGVPADRLVTSPSQLNALAREFTARTKLRVSGERLVLEIIRLRKSGRLPRLSA